MIQLTLILGAIGCFLLGTLIIVRNVRNSANLLAAGIVYSLAIWLLTILVFVGTNSVDIALVAAKTYYIIAATFVALLALFANVIPNNLQTLRQVSVSVLTSLALTIGFIVFLPGFIISDVVINSAGNYIQADNTSYAIYSVYFISLLLVSVFTIVHKLIKADRKLKFQLGIFLVGCLLMAIPGILADIMLPYSQNYHLSWVVLTAVVGVGVLLLFWATRKKMFDIRFAAVRTLAYVLSLSFVVVIYYSLATAISSIFFVDNVINQGTLGVVLALGLLLAFQPLKRFFDRLTNNVFYRDNYVTDEFFARLNKILTSTTDLRSLLERSANEVASTFKSEQAFFCVTTVDGRHITAGTDGHQKMPKEDALLLQGIKDVKHRVVVASLLKKDNEIYRLMKSHKVELVLPLTQSGVAGCLCLGYHLNSHYNSRDLKVLGTMADELVIAIQNMLSIQEVKDLNETLQQRVANATRELRGSNATLRELDRAKDEFVSMASHQLRTPLTSVKGYISMVLEGDAGKITETQRKFLEEAFTSSERMVNLINDFLNVSRLQTGKFVIEKHPVDLAKIVEQEIDGLKPSALSRDLRFKYKKPSNFPKILVDEGKLRQVIMNFCDNAIYYSHSGTAINVSLSLENNKAVFMVKDTGIGVPKEEQDQLFGKFFRATNARKQRPDGTGVGLFLARKVIDAHRGEIIFKSTGGKGSTFGFKLPIDN